MKMKKIFFVLFLLALLPNNSFGENKGELLLKSIQDKYKSISTISAEFKQLAGGKLNLEGNFYFEKSNKIRLELKHSVIVSNGVTNWSYNKSDNKVIITNYDKENPPLFSIDNLINSYPSMCQVSSQLIDGKNVLVLTAKNPSLKFSSIKIWLNGDNLIDKLLIDSSGKTIEITFSKYKINQKLNESRFSFTPPKGSSVVDLR